MTGTAVTTPQRAELLWRSLCAALLLVVAAYAITITPEADFSQNYIAARGWLVGLDPNGQMAELQPVCCPDTPLSSGIPQTAHPPITSVLVLPLALLPWVAARWALLLVSWALISATWFRLRVPPAVCLLTSPFWVVGLSLGALEPLLFLLVGAAISFSARAPGRAGASLGAAVAIKTYPGVLVFALLLAGRWRAVVAAGAAAVAITLVAELLLGPGVTRDWLAYAQVNAVAQADVAWNISLVKLVHGALPALSPGLAALGLMALLAAPMLPALRSGDPLRPMIPVMLLASPITWVNYLAFLALVELPRVERALLGFGGALLMLVWLRFIPGDSLAPLCYGPLLAAVALLWYRQAAAAVAMRKEQPVDGEHTRAKRV